MDVLLIEQQWEDCTKLIFIDKDSKATVFVHNYDCESWIGGLYVPEFRRKCGIASDLLTICESYCKHKPIKIGVSLNSPKWLIDYYLERGYTIIKDNE